MMLSYDYSRMDHDLESLVMVIAQCPYGFAVGVFFFTISFYHIYPSGTIFNYKFKVVHCKRSFDR